MVTIKLNNSLFINEIVIYATKTNFIGAKKKETTTK